MPRLAPRAKSPEGRSFREMRDRLLAGDEDETLPLREVLASRTAWAATHLRSMDNHLAAGGSFTPEQAALYRTLNSVVADLLREMHALDTASTDARPLGTTTGAAGAAS